MNIEETIQTVIAQVRHERRMDAIADKLLARLAAKDAAPKLSPTKSTFDAIWQSATPLYRCEDGGFRTRKQIRKWKDGGSDSITKMRQELQQAHCSAGCSTHPDTLCSCGH